MTQSLADIRAQITADERAARKQVARQRKETARNKQSTNKQATNQSTNLTKQAIHEKRLAMFLELLTNK